jgi:phage regulator Rha-like protein
MSQITIVEVAGELVVDSRIIAEQLGIKHKNFLGIIRSHQAVIEEHFGVLAFETAKPSEDSPGGRPETFVYLNEGQSTFVMTLSRNTPKVLVCKVGLVKAFSDQKRQLENPIDRKLFTELADRIAQLEKSVPALPPAMPAISTRNQISKLVNDYAFFTGFQHERVWRKIYAALNDHFNYDVSKKKAKGSKIDQIDADKQLDNLLSVAKQYLELPSL